MQNLPPLNSVKSCPKCGVKGFNPPLSIGFDRQYHPNHLVLANDDLRRSLSICGSITIEHILRTCDACGYRWPEACLT